MTVRVTNRTRQYRHLDRLRVECAWCGRHISGPVRTERVSHAICGACSAWLLADAGIPPQNAPEEEVELGGEG